MRFLTFMVSLGIVLAAPVSVASAQQKVPMSTGLYWLTTVPSWVPVSAANPLPMTSAPYSFSALGYQQITTLATATGLTVPTGSTIAQICIETAAVRYRDDGTAPTASIGQPVAAGLCFSYSGPLAAIQFITQGGSPVLDASYYK